MRWISRSRNDGVDGLTQTASSAKAWSPKRHRGKPSMKKFIRTAIDLGKTYFQGETQIADIGRRLEVVEISTT
jgi:hypothetical protein